ncbi:unnamed protein product [Macrosiphum euphorbiae]|uniref:DET1- and DDB1-associated protein 1 n=1 Tax=Macrosiphum euphorbiae TaxID=13131 RepID=A0AAV0VZU1_9HEMI|nr:unnamed protein product [Macrosiphum euphorbiae]
MSIAEFLDGFPSYDKRNFSSFTKKSCGNKSSSVYITTKDIPSEQTIANGNPLELLQSLHKKWDVKNLSKKRALVETDEEPSTSRKRPRVI